MSTFKDKLSSLLQRRSPAGGSIGWLDRLKDQRLTVLCYHRVQRSDDIRFQGFKPTISASQENFAKQMDYVRAHFNPISLHDLVGWVEDERQIPARPILVTFDDGYRDNAEVAWPIMRDRGIPAVIFLATDYIGTGRPFMWDFAAYCIAQTHKEHATVPLIGSTSLVTGPEQDAAVIAWVDAVKRLPGSARNNAMDELAAALDAPPPPQDMFRRLYLDWSDVHALARQGVEFGGHTCTHPILTQLPLEEAIREISDSIKRIAADLDLPPLGFAYPNGSARDYSRDHEQAVRQSGVPVAFSLEPGPVLLSRVREKRMAIPRVYIGQNDNMPRFIAKMNGAARLRYLLRNPRRLIAMAISR
jgi:peptidoglycan/xylan/chitin deacetylase (PgdA/CDA1 family)